MSLVDTIKAWLSANPAEQTNQIKNRPLSDEDRAKAKIDKAIEIIQTNKICENAALLINEYQAHEFASIKYSKKKGRDVAAKDLGQKEWLKVDTLVKYELADKVIELVAMQMNNWSSGTDEFGGFLIRFNGATVFETSCSRGVINEAYQRAFRVHAHPDSLATFKAGEWIVFLAYLVSEAKKEKARQKLDSENRAKEELKVRADKIDLG